MQYCTISRLDIAYFLNHLCQFFSSPANTHLQAAKRLLRYLKGTIHYGISLHKNESLPLVAYSNIDWPRCFDDRRNTNGHVLFLGSNIVSWCSGKQKVLSCSSIEAEYQALANATIEFSGLKYC